MTKQEVYQLFKLMIQKAEQDLLEFTLQSGLSVEHKADEAMLAPRK
jgi:hypothetical protein